MGDWGPSVEEVIMVRDLQVLNKYSLYRTLENTQRGKSNTNLTLARNDRGRKEDRRLGCIREEYYFTGYPERWVLGNQLTEYACNLNRINGRNWSVKGKESAAQHLAKTYYKGEDI